MNHKKIQEFLRTCIYIAGVLILLYWIGQLLFRYIQYGEQAQQETEEVQVFSDSETEKNLTETEAEEVKSVEAVPCIRVRILSQDYESNYHEEVTVTSDSPYQAVWMDRDKNDNLVEVQRKEYGAGEVFSVNGEEESAAEEICIQKKERSSEGLCITSFTRADGYPEYGGTLYLYREEEGWILINELPLEEYLYSVVSSEIPSGYPIEAQKAQAVCARTYAQNCMERVKEKEAIADLDDSVSFQVYNNYRSSEISRAAVDATAGEILDAEDALYYSTSCLSEHYDDLNSDPKFAAFLDEIPDEEAEYGSPWIRWSVGIDHQTILEQLKNKYGCMEDQIDQIEVTERSGDGQVQKLQFVCGEQTIEVEGEYQIRNILSAKNARIYLADGSAAEQMRMLPSAYFVLESETPDDGNALQTERKPSEKSGETDTENPIQEETLVNSEKVVYISGGGYGHGTGMSQCGAAAMAKAGADYEEILQYYYEANLVFLYE